MEIIPLSDAQAVDKAAAVLRRGGVILYPTDTLYGLGADALSDTAVAKIYMIKKRPELKPTHAIVADIEMANHYGEVHEKAFALMCAYMPGPLSLVLKKRPGLETGIGRGVDTFCVRIPDQRFCIDLAKAFGKPYTTTSANVSGAATGRSVKEILSQLGERASMIDLVIDAGELPASAPSTIVDASGAELSILREGALSRAELNL